MLEKEERAAKMDPKKVLSYSATSTNSTDRDGSSSNSSKDNRNSLCSENTDAFGENNGEDLVLHKRINPCKFQGRALDRQKTSIEGSIYNKLGENIELEQNNELNKRKPTLTQEQKKSNSSLTGVQKSTPTHVKIQVINTPSSSCNRKRRKSFLTGNISSPFANTPFLPIRSKLENDSHLIQQNSNYIQEHLSKKTKDIITEPKKSENELESNKINKPSNRVDLTRITSKGSDMSLTLLATSEETDSDPMFTQASPQPKALPITTSDAMEMEEDSNHMFTQALTQPKALPGSKCDAEQTDDDSDHMFSQLATQMSPDSNPSHGPQPLTKKSCVDDKQSVSKSTKNVENIIRESNYQKTTKLQLEGH